MSLREFEHFPKESMCPICGGSEDKPCFLMPIDDTQKDGICEAQPVHTSCMTDYANQFRLNKNVRVVYLSVAETWKGGKQ